MYKGASETAQAGRDRLTLADLATAGAPEKPRTPEQEREDLLRKWHSVSAEIQTLPKTSERRRELGLQIKEIQDRMHALRPKRHGPPNVNSWFIEIARGKLSKMMFKLIMDEAVAKAKAETPEETE